MEAQDLRALQAPLKQQYKDDPARAIVTLQASGRLDGAGVSCRVETGRAMVEAGLHPATGGTGLQACSGDMLLEALAACAGVTLKATDTDFSVGAGPSVQGPAISLLLAASGRKSALDELSGPGVAALRERP